MQAVFDRSRVEQLVRSALEELDRPGQADPHGAPTKVWGAEGAVSGALLLTPDRGVNLGAPFDAEAMKAMLAVTPARVAVGRAGTRYRTNTLLRFRADHAAAKDAVMSEVDEKLIERLGLVEIESRAENKAVFLQRPDLGRTLSEGGKQKLAEKVPKGAQLQVLYGDGLSAAALNAHLEAFHGALTRELSTRGIRLGPAVFVRRSRVKVMDEIARLTDAEACVFTCGERPGLGFADSLSAYYIYRPASGATDADREVVSNINPRGLEPTRAAAVVADNCARILRDKKSGVVL